MTKSSDRYARWFGTRVPLVSRGGIVLITTIGALLFSVIIYYGLMVTPMVLPMVIPNFDNTLIAILLSLVVGVLLHILILLFLKLRFHNPSTNPEFLDLVSRIHQKVVLSPKTQIWTRQSDEVFIASTYNPLFDAIIVSEPMVDLILRSPESGEVLLAFHLMRVPRTRWFGDLVGSVVIFIITTILSSLLLVPLVVVLVRFLSTGYIYGLTIISSLGIYFIGPILFILIVKGTFWRHEPAFVAVQEIYGMHPQVAKVQVEKGVILKEDEAQTVIWGVRDWEKAKRTSRRYGIMTLAAIPAFFLGLFLLYLMGPIPFSNYSLLIAALPLFLPAFAALVSYLLLRRWDNNAMGEVFQETTDYDEPIWVD